MQRLDDWYHRNDSFVCECGARITIDWDAPVLTYLHGGGEALLQIPSDMEGEELDQFVAGWKSRIHAYEREG